MTVYLDTNIFVYLEEGALTIIDLENAIGNKIDAVFYSASHIEEALEIKGDSEEQRIDRLARRLETIELFTQNKYIRETMENEIIKSIERPIEVYKTITEISFGQDAMKSLLSLVSEDQRSFVRKQFKIDPKKINNYSPQEVVEHLSHKLSSNGSNYTFLGMIESGIAHHPNGSTFSRSHRITAIFELLDMLGYWKDKPTEKSNYARIWDSSHTFYASFFDCFVTNDIRTINKAKVAYDIYNINTQIIKPSLKNSG